MSNINCIADIISIGDEILSGHTVNTNSSFIASCLYNIGIKTHRITAISDNSNEIIRSITEGITHADLVFVTGGLGPTHDDLTKNVICGMFGLELKFREDIWENILKLFGRRGIVPDDINKEQAMFPDSEIAGIIPNSCGTAPGLRFNIDEKYIFVMPGVPSEMTAMMKDHVIPFVKEKFSGDLYYRDINTTDIPESTLYSILSADTGFPFACDIAFLPQGYRITVRVKGTAESYNRKNDVENAVSHIASLVPEKIYTYDMVSPETELVNLLKTKKLTISAAESCTGGLVMKKITDVPGSSGVFCIGYVTYSNESKTEILAVNPHTLGIYGAVSEETVSEMLDGLLAVTQADIVCAVSGIAGPDGGSEAKPVGTVFAGFSKRYENKKFIRKYNLNGDRDSVREKAANKLLVEMIKHLKAGN